MEDETGQHSFSLGPLGFSVAMASLAMFEMWLCCSRVKVDPGLQSRLVGGEGGERSR